MRVEKEIIEKIVTCVRCKRSGRAHRCVIENGQHVCADCALKEVRENDNTSETVGKSKNVRMVRPTHARKALLYRT